MRMERVVERAGGGLRSCSCRSLNGWSNSTAALACFSTSRCAPSSGVLTALVISLLVGPPMIRSLSHFQIGQTVRDDGPESHFTKAGTPTMGGALILVAIATSTLFWSDLNNRFVWVVLVVTLMFGAIGWVDDYRKLVRGRPRRLARALQVSVAVGHRLGLRLRPVL